LFEKEKLFYEYDSKLLPVSEKVSQLVPWNEWIQTFRLYHHSGPSMAQETENGLV
jgi:hypothetical protein